MCKSEIFAKIINIVSKETEIPTELIVSDNRVTEIVNARYILVLALSGNPQRVLPLFLC